MDPATIAGIAVTIASVVAETGTMVAMDQQQKNSEARADVRARKQDTAYRNARLLHHGVSYRSAGAGARTITEASTKVSRSEMRAQKRKNKRNKKKNKSNR